MRNIIYITLGLFISSLSFETPLFAQNSVSQEESGVQKQNKKKKRNGRRGRKKKRSSRASSWYPAWPVGSFDFGIDPIIGIQVQSTSSEGTTTTGLTTEAGLGLSLRNIPIPGGNPGVVLSPQGGMTKGSVHQVTKTSGDTTTTDSAFTRTFGGGTFLVLLDHLRYRLGINSAMIEYDKSGFQNTKSLRIINEPGVLLKPGWAAFLTVSNLRLWYSDYDDPLFKESDYWLHTRKDLGVLSAFVDVGPGYTEMTQIAANADDPSQKIETSGKSSYVLGLAGMHLFWKIGGTLRIKYIIDASSKIDDRYADILLPDQKVSEPTALATMPSDSYEQTGSIGARDLIAGFGLVWSYHRVVYNYTEKRGKSHSKTDLGYQVTFNFGF